MGKEYLISDGENIKIAVGYNKFDYMRYLKLLFKEWKSQFGLIYVDGLEVVRSDKISKDIESEFAIIIHATKVK